MPRAVTLAGRVFLVSELTIGDLAELGGMADRRRPDPLEAVRDLVDADAVSPGDRHRIVAAFESAEGESAPAEAAPVEEAFAFLSVALRRHQPDLTAGEIGDLMRGLGLGEYRAFREAATRPDPMRVLTTSLDRWAGTGAADDGAGPDWGDWIDRVATSHGYTYPEIAAMPLAQFFNALNEGKSPEGRAVRPGEDPLATDRRWKAWFRGEDTKGAD